VVADEPSGLYRSPSGLADGGLLVSYRAGGGTWGIYVLDPHRGAERARVYDAPQWHDLDAVPVAARPEPVGRSSVVDDRLDTGLLYCMNAYISDTDESAGIDDGQIKWVQVLEARMPEASGRRDAPGYERAAPAPAAIGEELLGTVAVEPDGSFFLKVPARTPLRLRTLDAEGGVLQAMRSWFWVMPREGRGCIGCHEDRELSPPNRHTLALRKDPHPIGIAGEDEPAAPPVHPKRGYAK
jgi:hypothetical protein